MTGAASIEQGRIVYRFAREALEGTGAYRFLDNGTRIGITHKATNTRLRVIGSNGKTAMGLVGTPYAILDEPGAWEATGGGLPWDAISTAQGKPGSPLKAILTGTLAPARSGWWHDLVEAGTRPGIHVTALRGDPEKWDQWAEIRRCNPLTAVSGDFRRKLLRERDEARDGTRLKGRFLSYRLNAPTADESEMLLTVDDWQRVLALIAEAGLVKGDRIGGDSSTMEADAAWRSIVRRDTGEGCREMLKQMARESGVETPTTGDLARLARKRTGRKLSNRDRVSGRRPQDRDHQKDLDDGPRKTRISEPGRSGVSRWHGDEAARRAVTGNRARLASGVAREAFRLRAGIVKCSFARNPDRGGMPRP